MGRVVVWGALALLLFAGCGDDDDAAANDGGPDAALNGADGAIDAGGAAAVVPCSRDSSCDDGVFCNGQERCSANDADADERGCVLGTPPCENAAGCDEAQNICNPVCDAQPDADGDGHDAEACGGDDCDDADADRFPDRVEVCDAANHDEDCDLGTFGERDNDQDGELDALCWNVGGDEALRGQDCDDFDRTTQPNATETCDGLDNDCDGSIDEERMVEGFVDADHDLHGNPDEPRMACAGQSGFAAAGEEDDCKDDDPAVHGAQPELCDEVDNDCDGKVDEDAVEVPWYLDADGDGFGEKDGTSIASCERVAGRSVLASDCDDGTAAIGPAADELCDELDNDCDGRIDEATRADGYHDADGDGYGDPARPRRGCRGQVNFALVGGDCDDARPNVHPDQLEACDFVDNDCDGESDEELRVRGFADLDHDLHGKLSDPISGCRSAPGFSLVGDDCNDGDPAVHGAQPELCDQRDNDCDGEVDEEVAPVTWYRDRDGDGFGDSGGDRISSCAEVGGFSLLPLDCDDHKSGVYPGAPERCDGIDNDCSGFADFELARGDREDDDGDGSADRACPGGNDCDDYAATVLPGAPELCDLRDNDCDGQVEEGAAVQPFYLDADSDGFGDGSKPAMRSCAPLPKRVTRAGDCDDADNTVRPGLLDDCDAVDTDCDGAFDEDAPQFAFYADSDGDGFAGGAAKIACSAPVGALIVAADCDDAEPSVYPGAAESCQGRDDNCDGVVDEGVSADGYQDRDGDLHGDPDKPVRVCLGRVAFALAGDDCNDDNPSVFSGQAEVCDQLDNDCDLKSDEDAQPHVWYLDADADGFGDASQVGPSSCAPLAGYSITSGDCDDERRASKPGAVELCDGLDNDCDGESDEDLVGLSPEICDGVFDENCDGEVDEGCECAVGVVESCGSDVGECESGLRACDWPGVWSACRGSRAASKELCGDQLDSDCNGQDDNGCQ